MVYIIKYYYKIVTKYYCINNKIKLLKSHIIVLYKQYYIIIKIII